MNETHDIQMKRQAAKSYAASVRAELPVSSGPEQRFCVPFDDASAAFGGELLIDIDPGHFKRYLPFQVRTGAKLTRICDFFHGSGAWESISFDFREKTIFREMEEILKHGGWSRDLAAHRDCVQQMAQGRPRSSNGVALDSLERIDQYFESCAGLLVSIRAHGVMRRPAFQPERAADYQTSSIRSLHSELIESDVGIALGADGELYRACSGLHRTAAAILLGVHVMPVQLRLVHLGLLQTRMRDDKIGIVGALRNCIAFARETYGAREPAPLSPSGETACPAIFK